MLLTNADRTSWKDIFFAVALDDFGEPPLDVFKLQIFQRTHTETKDTSGRSWSVFSSNRYSTPRKRYMFDILRLSCDSRWIARLQILQLWQWVLTELQVYRMLQQNQILQAVGLTTGFSWLWPYCGMRPTMAGTISSTGWTYIKREDVAVWQWIWGTIVAEPLPAPSTATSLSRANAHSIMSLPSAPFKIAKRKNAKHNSLWRLIHCTIQNLQKFADSANIILDVKILASASFLKLQQNPLSPCLHPVRIGWSQNRCGGAIALGIELTALCKASISGRYASYALIFTENTHFENIL